MINTEQKNDTSKNIPNKESLKDLMNFFENFIKTGIVRKEGLIAPDFPIRVRTLTTEEILRAETKIMQKVEGLNISDVFLRIRVCAILAIAIEKIGDNELYTDEELQGLSQDAEKSKLDKQAMMYTMLLKMPPALIEKAYDLYTEALNEQTKLYSNPDAVIDQSENFSEHPTDEF